MKSSFILHFEQALIFDAMSDSQAGQLIKRIFQHAMTGESDDCDDAAVKFSMIPIRTRMDSDHAFYLQTCQKRSEYGKMGGRGNTKAKAFQESISFSDKANESKRKQKKPSDIDIDSDVDHDFKSKEYIPTTPKTEPSGHEGDAEQKDGRPNQCPPELWARYLKISKGFHLDKATQLGARAPFTDAKVLEGAKALDNLTRIKGRPLDEIVAILGWSMEDAFWSPNLRSIKALLKTGSNGETKYANVLTAMTRDLERRAERSMAANG